MLTATMMMALHMPQEDTLRLKFQVCCRCLSHENDLDLLATEEEDIAYAEASAVFPRPSGTTTISLYYPFLLNT